MLECEMNFVLLFWQRFATFAIDAKGVGRQGLIDAAACTKPWGGPGFGPIGPLATRPECIPVSDPARAARAA